MIIMKGKYNIAKIFLPEDQFEEMTKNQIQTFLNHPAFKGNPICIMPDTHAGIGGVIGFTFEMNNYVVPNVVGVDIGCGVSSYNLGQISIDLQKLDLFINKNIPSGFHLNNHKNPQEKLKSHLKVLDEDFEKYYRLEGALEDITNKINPKKYNDFCNSIGSLGGGNHFIELGKDDNDNLWLTVHTGSRNFGLQVANYHQNKAKLLLKQFFIEDDRYKYLEFLPLNNGGNDYLNDMKWAQRYASLNREVILSRIVKGAFKEVYDRKNTVESIHNYIDYDTNMIRKGAISAKLDEKVVIPFNMEDGLIIGKGLGNKEWNYSAPHGAGRILSRTKAKEILNLDDAKKSMSEKGIYTTSLNLDTVDEVKGAYKDKDMIIEAIKDTVKITNFVKPIYNFKAGE